LLQNTPLGRPKNTRTDWSYRTRRFIIMFTRRKK
jgi:hypothetical protein